MHNSAWIELLQRLTPEQQAQLVLTTHTGTELYIQSLFRIEPEFLVIRGRMGGSSDLGKTYFVPFDQIQYLGFREDLKEEVVHAIFGGPSGNGQKPPPPTAESPAAAEGEDSGRKDVAPVGSKAALLERLRKARAVAGSVSVQQHQPSVHIG